MPVENRKSTIVSNADAVPVVLTNPRISGGYVASAVATVEVAAADDDTSQYRLFRLPSNAKVLSIRILNDAITGGTSYDLGVYRTAKDGGAVVSVGAFGTAIDMSSARTTAFFEGAFEAQDIANIERELWQTAGLTADPSVQYDIVLTANTVGTAAGTISAIVQYIA
jgi:hypothetical protein